MERQIPLCVDLARDSGILIEEDVLAQKKPHGNFFLKSEGNV